METKLNIAEILKDKPEGTKLWTDVFGSVTLYVVTDACDAFQVKHHIKEPWFDKEGKLYREGVLCIYPSNSMRDWSKFAWKKGDVLVSNDSTTEVIFKGWKDDTYTLFGGAYALTTHKDGKVEYGSDSLIFETCNYKGIEVEDAAQCYINYIEKRLGGKLNLETLEIEKPKPEFKDGDIVFVESHMLGINTSSMIAIFRKDEEIDKYKFSPALCESNEHDTYLREDSVVLSPSGIKIFRPATDSEKQQLFDALAKEIKAWDAEKKQIVNLEPKWTPKTFDRVITRDFDDGVWSANIFSHMNSQGEYVSIGCVEGYAYCLPYNEETAKLIGTTKDVED